MELKDLVGIYYLSGVEFGVWPNGWQVDRDANSMAFILNDTVYFVYEDPSDGYRSHMAEILTYNIDQVPIKNQFPRVPVIGALNSDDGVLDFRDQMTGRIVLSVGTDHSDGYYPTYIAKFYPDYMTVKGVVEKPKINKQEIELDLLRPFKNKRVKF